MHEDDDKIVLVPFCLIKLISSDVLWIIELERNTNEKQMLTMDQAMTSNAVSVKFKSFWASSPCNSGNWVISRSSERSSIMLEPFISRPSLRYSSSVGIMFSLRFWIIFVCAAWKSWIEWEKRAFHALEAEGTRRLIRGLTTLFSYGSVLSVFEDWQVEHWTV